MIHQIILSRLHTRRRRKINPILLARLLDVLVSTRQTHDIRMEFLEVFFQDGGSVARRIAGYHDREDHVSAFCFHLVDHFGHFVEFVWADVWAVGEAEVDLQFSHTLVSVPFFLWRGRKERFRTYQRILPMHILMRKLMSILINQIKRASNLRSPYPLRLLRNPLSRQPLLLVVEVCPHARAGGNEKDRGGEIEGLLSRKQYISFKFSKEVDRAPLNGMDWKYRAEFSLRKHSSLTPPLFLV